ncbi:MAG: ATP-binding protein [Chitinophagales bacterium]
MFKSFKWKLVLSFIIPILLLVLIIGLTVVKVVDHFYLQQIEQQLINEARLIAAQTQPSDYYEHSSALAEIVAEAAKNSRARVTLIAADGTVLADSDEDPSQMTNHSNRPEVHAALLGQTGSITRQSSTLHIRMKYAAVPVKQDSRVIGVVRLALPLSFIDALLNRLWWIILAIMGLAAILAAFVSYRMATRLAEPIIDLTEVADSITQGNLKGRVYYDGEDEIGTLAGAMNTMAQRLEEKIGELTDTKARLESILANSVNGVVLMGTDRHILTINNRACELFSVDKESALNRHQLEITHSYAINDAIEQALREERDVQMECILHILGEKIVQVYAVPVLSQTGNLETILLVLNDITELKRLETIRKDFVANVSHELRTPMAAISGFAETLMQENAENETVYEFSRIIHDEATRLSRLVNSLLELSRVEAADPDLKLTSFNMYEVITDTVTKLEQQTKTKNVIIDLELSAQNSEVQADRDRIDQVMINILDNAIMHSPENGTVRISLSSTSDEVEVIVADEGHGVPDGEEDRIFERFYRVDRSRSRKAGGTGLGLSIAKHIIEVHKGTIGVKTNDSGGASFYFTLPLKQGL